LRATSLPQHGDDQHQDHDRQQHDEDEQSAFGPLELQVVPASAHPLVPGGAQRDRKILKRRHLVVRPTYNPTNDLKACVVRRGQRVVERIRRTACVLSASALSSAAASSLVGRP
jgi:hypothetical protein